MRVIGVSSGFALPDLCWMLNWCRGAFGRAAPARQERGLSRSALLRPQLEGWVLFWVPQYQKKNIKGMEMIALEGKPYEECMKSLAMFSLEERVKGNLISVYSFLTSSRF